MLESLASVWLLARSLQISWKICTLSIIYTYVATYNPTLPLIGSVIHILASPTWTLCIKYNSSIIKLLYGNKFHRTLNNQYLQLSSWLHKCTIQNSAVELSFSVCLKVTELHNCGNHNVNFVGTLKCKDIALGVALNFVNSRSHINIRGDTCTCTWGR